MRELQTKYKNILTWTNFRDRKMQKICIFMPKLLRNSKKSSNFAAKADIRWSVGTMVISITLGIAR